MKKLTKSILAAAVIFTSSSAFAACEGSVDSYKVSSDGLVSVTGSFVTGGGAAKICNLSTERMGVSPEICKVYLSSVVTAKATGSQIATSFTSCHYQGYNYVAVTSIEVK